MMSELTNHSVAEKCQSDGKVLNYGLHVCLEAQPMVSVLNNSNQGLVRYPMMKMREDENES